jgi:hypothetical protein
MSMVLLHKKYRRFALNPSTYPKILTTNPLGKVNTICGLAEISLWDLTSANGLGKTDDRISINSGVSSEILAVSRTLRIQY